MLSPRHFTLFIMQAPRESDLASSEDASSNASSSSRSKDDISSFVDKKVGGRERKIRRKASIVGNSY